MKKLICLILVLLAGVSIGNSQTTDDVLNLLLQHKVISQKDADSIKAAAKKKPVSVTGAKPIQLSGYTHFRYQINDEPRKMDGFDVRRAYVDIKSAITQKWSIRFQFNMANSAKITDAYTNYKMNEYFNFTIGQFSIPFSLENLSSNTKLEIIDRSQVVEALVARGKDVIGNHIGRDIGLQIGGTLIKLNGKSLIDYKIGMFNGQGINTTDKNESKDISTRLVLHTTDWLNLGTSYYNGQGNWGTPAKNRQRKRFGLDANVVYGDFTFNTEFISGQDASIKKNGYYVQAGYYVIPKKLQFVGKWDCYDPNTDIDDNTSTWYVAGVNYVFNSNVRLQFNYTIKEEQGNKIDNNLASLQFQAAF